VSPTNLTANQHSATISNSYTSANASNILVESQTLPSLTYSAADYSTLTD